MLKVEAKCEINHGNIFQGFFCKVVLVLVFFIFSLFYFLMFLVFTIWFCVLLEIGLNCMMHRPQQLALKRWPLGCVHSGFDDKALRWRDILYVWP